MRLSVSMEMCCFFWYQDMLEKNATFIDGIKFKGGLASLMPKSFLKEIAHMAHQHGLYLSTGGWAEHVLQRGPSAFKQYIQVTTGKSEVFSFWFWMYF